MSAVPLLLLLDDVDELLLVEDESLPPSSSSTGGRAPPRRIETGFGAAFRASLGERRGLCRGSIFILLLQPLSYCCCRGMSTGHIPLPNLLSHAGASSAEQNLRGQGVEG